MTVVATIRPATLEPPRTSANGQPLLPAGPLLKEIDAYVARPVAVAGGSSARPHMAPSVERERIGSSPRARRSGFAD
jgi:hypothetical protein